MVSKVSPRFWANIAYQLGFFLGVFMVVDANFFLVERIFTDPPANQRCLFLESILTLVTRDDVCAFVALR